MAHGVPLPVGEKSKTMRTKTNVKAGNLLSNLLKLLEDTQKGIIANIR
jgi:hypothetical protein